MWNLIIDFSDQDTCPLVSPLTSDAKVKTWGNSAELECSSLSTHAHCPTFPLCATGPGYLCDHLVPGLVSTNREMCLQFQSLSRILF